MTNSRENHSFARGSGPAGTGVLARSMRQLPSLSVREYPSMRTVRAEYSHAFGMVSHRSSSKEHSIAGDLIQHERTTSTFLPPLAPLALPSFSATMGTLTPAQRRQHPPPYSRQVSLVHTERPSLHSVTNHPTRPVIAFLLPTQRDRLPEAALMGSPGHSRSGLRT